MSLRAAFSAEETACASTSNSSTPKRVIISGPSTMQAASRSATRKPLFDFAQRQNAAIRRQQAAVEFDHDRLAGSG